MITRTRPPEEQTVKVARKRFARRQLRRRLVLLRPVLIGLAIAAALAGLVWVFFFSSWLAAEEVEVRGTDVVTPRKVLQLAAVPLGKPLARIDTDAIQARIEDLAPVKSVDVSRCWPHKICIEVTERQSVAVVDREGKLWGLDETGILFRQYAQAPADLPAVHMKATTSTDALAEAAEIVSSLPASVAEKVAYLDVSTVDEISLHLRRGATVIWGSADDSYTKARVLEPLLKAKPDAKTYNVSVPGNPTVSVG
jgi:cell division protein FtsQ